MHTVWAEADCLSWMRVQVTDLLAGGLDRTSTGSEAGADDLLTLLLRQQQTGGLVARAPSASEDLNRCVRPFLNRWLFLHCQNMFSFR